MATHIQTCKAVLFDFDGTLTNPGALDFSAIKKALDCPVDRPILEFINSLSEPSAQKKAMEILDGFEIKGAKLSTPNPDSEAVITSLHSKGIKVGIITRNGLKPVLTALKNFPNLRSSDFDIIISRDDPVEPKPSGDGVLQAGRKLDIAPAEMLVVGDYLFDIQAGKNAGAKTVLLTSPEQSEEWANLADFQISSLLEVNRIVSYGLPLSAGKLPNHMLEDFFSSIALDDPTLLIPPGVGEDTAAVDIQGEEVIILKSDPITFVSDAAEYYSVLINANDILTSGAIPRWFLTSILFPVGTMPSDALKTLSDLERFCNSENISLCGGHTEITDAVNRTIITGMMIGTVSRNGLVDKKSMRTGDVILLSKGVSVEGTAIIAAEFKDRLLQLEMPSKLIETCLGFSSQISIREEATIARGFEGLSAMHDVTEGGLASALLELSQAGQHRFQIQLDKIPIYPETQTICHLLHIDPLGLIGSGSLLICCAQDTASTLCQAVRKAGIDMNPIGVVAEKGLGIEASHKGSHVDWPIFEVDEITRLFQTASQV